MRSNAKTIASSANDAPGRCIEEQASGRCKTTIRGLIIAALLGLAIGEPGIAGGAEALFADVSAPPESTPAPSFSLEILPIFRYWRPSLSGNMTITAGGQPGSGSRVDFSDDLDLGTVNAFEGGISVLLGRHELGARYDPSSFHGDATLDRTIVFHGTTYPTGERASSDVSLDFAIPEYSYRLWSLDGADLQAGIRGYIWTFDAELRGSGSGGGLDENRSFTHALPAGFFTLANSWGSWGISGTAAGGLIASDRYVADFEAGIGYSLFQNHVELDLGYRWLRTEFHETTNLGALTESGLLVSVLARFSL